MLHILNDNRFNIFFSLMLGIGIVCIVRPMCSGSECNISKPPISKDFDKYVYRMGSKCFEFTPEVKECPTSGAIEAFREQSKKMETPFLKSRESPIRHRE
jgi:hypothetical protein